MKVQEIIARMNGLSTPVGGISWTPPVPDVTKARQVISFLEDRRVLYNNMEYERPRHCIESVIRIRSFLTDQLAAESPPSAELAAIIRAMRAACRKFLGNCRYMHRHNAQRDFILTVALGELRGEFGWLVGALAAKYGLDVEDDLATIIPGDDEALAAPDSLWPPDPSNALSMYAGRPHARLSWRRLKIIGRLRVPPSEIER
jgi:hypothetical protein